MARKGWTWAPNRRLKPTVPDDLKAEVQVKADVFIEEFLKPNFIKKPSKNYRWKYIIHAKGHRSFFYFVATVRSPGPNALSPTFEAPFSRLEYVGNHCFNLAYMRHTDKWWEVYQGLTLEECLKTIREEGIFQPVKI